MTSRLLYSIVALCTALAAQLPARAVDPAQPEWPPTIEVRTGGLQTSLVLGTFKVRVGSSSDAPTQPSTPPVLGRTSFPALAVLENRSNSNVPFTFPDAASAARKWTFRLFDSTGAKIWQSDLDPVGDAPSVESPLLRGSRWRRNVQIPLTLNNAPLPPGLYTVEASVDADKQLGATAVFEVSSRTLPPPDAKATGIRGLVLRASGSREDPTASQELPVGGAAIVVSEIIPPESAQVRAPFTWRGVTNHEGRFQVNTPPGRFQVTATLPQGPEANPLPPASRSVQVEVETGRFNEVIIRFPAAPVNVTGVRGLVQQENPNGPPFPAAQVRVTVTELPGLTTRPPFAWEGTTDAHGRFQVNAPAGRYRVTAHPTSIGVLPVVPPPVSKEVTVQTGAIAEVTLLLPARLSPPPPPEALVHSVHEVTLSSDETRVTITARGSVNTGGWSNPRLRRRNTTSGSGMIEFDFVAQPPPPNAPVTQAIVQVTASATVERTAEFRGARVYSRSNRQEAELPR